jgi:hypothetical protein
VRLALGASRGRLVRQFLTETLVLAFLGAAAGFLIALWGQQWIPGVAGQGSALDWRVLVFCIGVTMAVGVVVGVAPAVRATASVASVGLKEATPRVAPSRTMLSRALLALQVAISLVLLVGAGLFIRTL